MSTDNLSSCNLIRSVFALYESNRLIKITQRESLNESQLYVFDTFLSITKIINTLDILDLIVKKISEFRPSECENFDNFKFNTNDILELRYHFENFFLRIEKVKDQLLLFINQVLELGLANRKCNFKNVKSNVKGKLLMLPSKEPCLENVQQLLEKFEGIFSDITKYRNFIAHRGEYRDEDLEEINVVLLINEMRYGNSPDKNFNTVIPRSSLRILLCSLIDKHTGRMKTNVVSLSTWVYQFFETTDEIFNYIYSIKSN